MSKKQKVTPIYDIDKYGLRYRVNPELSENDKESLRKIKELLLNRDNPTNK